MTPRRVLPLLVVLLLAITVGAGGWFLWTLRRQHEETVRQLHARYQRGELSFRAVAAELGLPVRELYDLFEQKGLPT